MNEKTHLHVLRYCALIVFDPSAAATTTTTTNCVCAMRLIDSLYGFGARAARICYIYIYVGLLAHYRVSHCH